MLVLPCLWKILPSCSVSCRGSIQSVHTPPRRRVSTPLPSANNQREYFYRWFSVSVRQNDTLAETGGARSPYHYRTMECPCPDQNLTCPYLHAVIHRFEKSLPPPLFSSDHERVPFQSQLERKRSNVRFEWMCPFLVSTHESSWHHSAVIEGYCIKARLDVTLGELTWIILTDLRKSMVVNGEGTPLSCNHLFMTSSRQCGRTTCTRVGYKAHKNQSIAGQNGFAS